MCGGAISDISNGFNSAASDAGNAVNSNLSDTANQANSNTSDALNSANTPGGLTDTIGNTGTNLFYTGIPIPIATTEDQKKAIVAGEVAVGTGLYLGGATALTTGANELAAAEGTEYAFTQPEIGASYAESIAEGNAVVDPSSGYLSSGIGAANGATTNAAQAAAASSASPFWSAAGAAAVQLGAAALQKGNASQQAQAANPNKIAVGGTTPKQNPSIGSSAPMLSGQSMASLFSSPYVLAGIAVLGFAYFMKRGK